MAPSVVDDKARPPAGVMVLVDAASRDAEGRGIRVTVSSRAELDVVRHLVRAKMAPQPRGAR